MKQKKGRFVFVLSLKKTNKNKKQRFFLNKHIQNGVNIYNFRSALTCVYSVMGEEQEHHNGIKSSGQNAAIHHNVVRERAGSAHYFWKCLERRSSKASKQLYFYNQSSSQSSTIGVESRNTVDEGPPHSDPLNILWYLFFKS